MVQLGRLTPWPRPRTDLVSYHTLLGTTRLSTFKESFKHGSRLARVNKLHFIHLSVSKTFFVSIVRNFIDSYFYA